MADNAKKFSPSGLTHSAAHHLLAVDEAVRRRGYARVSDIARELGITRGSVSVAMQSLRLAGFVEQDENHMFRLSPIGQRLVASLRVPHEIVEEFLTRVLGLTQQQSHRESCRIENLVEVPTARRLSALLRYWRESDLPPLSDSDLETECPACGDPQPQLCPCCGLECIGGACPLEAQPAGEDSLAG